MRTTSQSNSYGGIVKGVITKKNADIFTINSDGRIVEIKARGKIKKEGL